MYTCLTYLYLLTAAYEGFSFYPVFDYSMLPGVTNTYKMMSMTFGPLLLSNSMTPTTQPIQQALVPSVDLGHGGVSLFSIHCDVSLGLLETVFLIDNERSCRPIRGFPDHEGPFH
jgi:hypothetical protein